MKKIINLIRINWISLSTFCIIVLVFSIIDSFFFIPIANKLTKMYQWQKRTGILDLIITKNIEEVDLYLTPPGSDIIIDDNKILKSGLVFLSKNDDKVVHSEFGKGHNASIYLGLGHNMLNGFAFDNEINYFFPINNSLFSLLKNTIIIDGVKDYIFVQKGVRFLTSNDFVQFQKGDILIELNSYFVNSYAKIIGLFFLRCLFMIIVLNICLKIDTFKSLAIFFNRLKYNGVKRKDIFIYNFIVLFVIMLPCLVIIPFISSFIFIMMTVIFSNIIIFVLSSFFARRNIC